MERPHVASVDVGALLAVAREYDGIAELVDDAVRRHLTRLSFDGAGAGRRYIAHGEALRDAVDAAAGGLRDWARAALEIASALRDAVDRYVEADARAARRVG